MTKKYTPITQEQIDELREILYHARFNMYVPEKDTNGLIMSKLRQKLYIAMRDNTPTNDTMTCKKGKSIC